MSGQAHQGISGTKSPPWSWRTTGTYGARSPAVSRPAASFPATEMARLRFFRRLARRCSYNLPPAPLNPDLQHLIHLQELDSTADRQRRRVADIPALQAALDARLAERTAAVDSVKARIAACQS